MMVGQSKLLKTIDNHISKGAFPRTVLLEGDYGCGKHTVASYIAEKLQLTSLDITEMLNLETLEQITLSVTPRLYIIDSTKISVKEQNVILKFLEEPLKNSYIIMLTENKNSLLNTVVNRCVCWTFEQYTIDELKTFLDNTDKEYILHYANTPGRILLLEQHPVLDMINFADKILTQVRVANHSNILTIPNKINFKENPELFDFDILVYIMLLRANRLYDEQQIPYFVCELTGEFYNDCKIPRINKKNLFENYLFRLKQGFEGGV